VPRLLRLAEIYEVPPDQLLPRDSEFEINLTDGVGEGLEEGGFTIDLVRLHALDDPDASVLSRYAATIQLQRQDFNGRLLTIRRDDLRVLAAVLGRGATLLGNVTTPSPTQIKILVPGNHLMVGLLGQRDELLRIVEGAFPVGIHVRGNEITISGEEREAERVARLFEEMVLLLERGHTLDREGVTRSIEMLKADQRPTDVLTTEVVRGRKTVRPKTAGQKRYVDAVRSHTVTFAIGPAGTGKSYLAVALAVQALQAKEINRIILTRPAVEAGERLGFLPGDMLAKVDPYLRPLYDALYDMLEAEGVTRLMERGTIEVAPLAYMRGRTLNDSFIILDEAQNTTPEQMKMFLTRLGFGSKIVVTGDVTQIDLAEGRGRSGLLAVRDVLDGVDDLVFVELGSGDVVRHRIVQDIVDAYARHDQTGKQ
jgi:phosphate starvation-inducible PhoH-like protein